MRRVLTFAVIVVALLFLVAVALPFFDADHYRPRIQSALETALNRRVQIGKVHLTLFTGPGFTLDDVYIQDEPAAGIEPFARVETLRARLKLTSLFTGHLAFSQLRLDNPWVNIVNPVEGPWNISAFLSRTAQAPGATGSPAAPQTVPDISIRNGRINFKYGLTKSIFYIANADVDMYPNSDRDIVIRFTGEPARTDRGAIGFGRFDARGLLRQNSSGKHLNLGVHLERTSLSDLATLAYGRDIGVHGFALLTAHIAGPLSDLGIDGGLTLDDVHRWDLMPLHGEVWNLKLKGKFDVPGQKLELEAINSAVSVQFRAASNADHPHWATQLTLTDVPAGDFAAGARHMGAPLPVGVELSGKTSGVITLANDSPLSGKLSIDAGALKFTNSRSAAFDTLPITLDDQQVTFGPAPLAFTGAPSPAATASLSGEGVTFAGHYSLDGQTLGFRLAASQLPLAELQSDVIHLAGAQIPLLDQIRQGTFAGTLVYERENATSPGTWTGAYDIAAASLDVPGLASPVRLDTASVTLQPAAVRIDRMRGRAGTQRFDGAYNLATGSIRLSMAQLDLAECQRLLTPTLRRPSGLLARLRSDAPAVPAWLSERQLEGSLRAKNAVYGDTQLGALNLALVWEGTSIRLTGLDPRTAGSLSVDLSTALPAYAASFHLRDLDYHGGKLDLAGDFNSNGLGTDFLANAKASGDFSGHSLTLTPDADFREITGNFAFSNGRLTLQNIEAQQGADTLTGQAASQPDGRLLFDLASARKTIHLTASLVP